MIVFFKPLAVLEIAMGCIYVAKNTANNKKYVGRAMRGMKSRQNIHERDARKGSLYLFHAAIRKYGTDRFVWAILEDNVSTDDLNKREMYWIAELGTYKSGYNLTQGGGGQHGFEHSDSTKAKIREAAKKRTGDKAPNYGKKFSVETRLKISEKAKLRAHEKGGFFGRKHTEETKAKIRRYQLENSKTLGRSPSLESKRKMSIAASRRWQRKRETTQDQPKIHR